MLHGLLQFLSYIVGRIPAGLRYAIGLGLGYLCWPLIPAKRKKMVVNNIILSLELTEQEALEIARKSAVRFGPMFFEVLALPVLTENNIAGVVCFEGEERLAAALQSGKGAILATAHSGNWELLGAALAMRGFPLVAVAQKQTSKVMDRFINELRTGAGMQIVYKHEVRYILRILGQGKLLGLLIDQDAHGDGIFVEFFQRIASTPQGAAVFARLKDIPIVPAFITEVSPGRHKVLIHEPVYVTKTANREADIFAATQVLTRRVEEHIRQKPAEWFWLHNRWKTKK